jgi:hypothetical protein
MYNTVFARKRQDNSIYGNEPGELPSSELLSTSAAQIGPLLGRKIRAAEVAELAFWEISATYKCPLSDRSRVDGSSAR